MSGVIILYVNLHFVHNFDPVYNIIYSLLDRLAKLGNFNGHLLQFFAVTEYYQVWYFNIILFFLHKNIKKLYDLYCSQNKINIDILGHPNFYPIQVFRIYSIDSKCREFYEEIFFLLVSTHSNISGSIFFFFFEKLNISAKL